MKNYVVERFGAEVAAEAASRWGINDADLIDLGGFESFVYEAPIAGADAVLKIGHSDRRSVDLLVAEAEFTRYLAAESITVSAALVSSAGNLVERMPDGSGAEFLATAWSKAPGDAVGRENDDAKFWAAHGALLGRMHSASISYKPTGLRRPDWDDMVFLDDSLHIPETDIAATQHRDTILRSLRELPKDRGTYGLVHHDAHGGNVLFDGTAVTIFDFDDCGYNWFANDLAIVMYYSLLAFDDPVDAAHSIWPVFIDAYQNHHHLEPWWFEQFALFLAWRDNLLLSVIHRSRASITDMDVDAWIAGYHERHATGLPLIDFDFTTGVVA